MSAASTQQKRDLVRAAYLLLLGREPENEAVVSAQSNFVDPYELRNRILLGDEHKIHDRVMRLAEMLYWNEADVGYDTKKFDAVLSLEPRLEDKIQNMIQQDDTHPKYTAFHKLRFFDQIRAVVGIRHKMLASVERPRLLDVGTSSVSSMYARITDDIDVYTANLPSGAPPLQIARRFGSKEHYYIDLDAEDLSERYPALKNDPFHIILLCEVIEHLRASPEEIFADLLSILAPGGVLLISTPNAMSARSIAQLAIGKKIDFIYSKKRHEFHHDHHAHVREYTRSEIRDALCSCGATVLMHAVKNYYSDSRKNIISAKYVSARDAQIAVATRPTIPS